MAVQSHMQRSLLEAGTSGNAEPGLQTQGAFYQVKSQRDRLQKKEQFFRDIRFIGQEPRPAPAEAARQVNNIVTFQNINFANIVLGGGLDAAQCQQLRAVLPEGQVAERLARDGAVTLTTVEQRSYQLVGGRNEARIFGNEP